MYKDVQSRALYKIGNLGAETHRHMFADMYKDVHRRAVYHNGYLAAECGIYSVAENSSICHR